LFPFSTDSDFEDDPTLPKVLPPFLPPKIAGSKDYTLVLDLDETLIHFDDNEDEENDGEVFYMVRPGVSKFLSELSLYYEIVIFTAALSEYADWILNQIDQKKNISHRLYR
jgi:CTD small phosphatase-like protein 2